MGAWDVPLHVRQRIESKWTAQKKRMERQRDAGLTLDDTGSVDGLDHEDADGRRSCATPATR